MNYCSRAEGTCCTGPTIPETRYLSSEEVDDFKGMLDNAHSHQLLAVVAAMHHHGVGEALNYGALSLAEPLGGISPPRVWEVLSILLLHSNVILVKEMGIQ